MSRFLVVLCLLVGCGTTSRPNSPDASHDAPTAPLACGTTGAARTTGTYLGQSIAPVRAIRTTFNGALPALVFDASGMGCAGPDPMTSRGYVAMVLCTTPMVTTYALTDIGSSCSDDKVLTQIDAMDASNMRHTGSATGGSLTITSIDASCIKGTFAGQFDADTVSGEFAAIVCP